VRQRVNPSPPMLAVRHGCHTGTLANLVCRELPAVYTDHYLSLTPRCEHSLLQKIEISATF
jgi:hypothetical protein